MLAVSNLLDVNSDTSLGAYRWDEAHGWRPTAPNGSCDSNTTFALSVDNHGSVYGLTYIDTAFVCHHPAKTSQGSKMHAGETLKVEFPGEFDEQLANGDTVGRCP